MPWEEEEKSERESRYMPDSAAAAAAASPPLLPDPLSSVAAAAAVLPRRPIKASVHCAHSGRLSGGRTYLPLPGRMEDDARNPLSLEFARDVVGCSTPFHINDKYLLSG